MKRTLAKGIIGLAALAALQAIGYSARGPRSEGIGRDVAVGAVVVGTAFAIKWAQWQLEAPDEEMRP